MHRALAGRDGYLSSIANAIAEDGRISSLAAAVLFLLGSAAFAAGALVDFLVVARSDDANARDSRASSAAPSPPATEKTALFSVSKA